MSNLQLRIVSAIVLAAVVLGLTRLGGLPFRVLAALAGALVFHEWSTVSGMRSDRAVFGLCWLLVAAALVALVGVALATDPWALLGVVGFLPLARAARTVGGGATGKDLIPVLQLTGVGELLYAAGVFAGLLLAR